MLIHTINSPNGFTFTVLNINTIDAGKFLGRYGNEMDISINTMHGASIISVSCSTRESFDKACDWFKKRGHSELNG